MSYLQSEFELYGIENETLQADGDFDRYKIQSGEEFEICQIEVKYRELEDFIKTLIEAHKNLKPNMSKYWRELSKFYFELADRSTFN